jgi:branched-chain amino acid transport system substrate-binding protein
VRTGTPPPPLLGSILGSPLLGAAALLAVFLIAPLMVGGYHVFQLTQLVIYAVALLGLNLLTGYTGQVSLGHGAFYALGAYSTAILLAQGGTPYWLVPVPVAGVCFLVGWLFGRTAARLEGIYLALATFALAIAMPQFLKLEALQRWTGGSQGVSVSKPSSPLPELINDDRWLYYFCLLVAVLLFALVWNVVRGRTGRALLALRDHPIAAAAMGIDVAAYKSATFGVSAMVTGVAGGLGAVLARYISPDEPALDPAAGRQRHRRHHLDLRHDLRRRLHSAGAGSGQQALHCRAVGHLRRALDRLHDGDASWCGWLAAIGPRPAGARLFSAVITMEDPLSSPRLGTLSWSFALALVCALVCALVGGCGKKKEGGGGGGGSSAAGAALESPAAASAATPGVTATEIKFGQSVPYSGPASAYAVLGHVESAYFKMINDKGGIKGRKLTLISLDDGYSPPKTVEQTRKLVEQDGVAFLFGTVGTAHNSAIQPYLEQKKVPQLFVATGAHKFADPAHPWTMGWQPSYQVEALLYARHILQDKPGAKVCVIYQNDDFGKDFLAGLQKGFGDQYDKMVVKTASYEVTDPTVDSQLVTLQAAGCNALVTAATPKFAAQTIRKIYDIGWKPQHYLSNVSVSISSVLTPAGLDKSTGIITGVYLKDPSDPTLADDPGLNEYREFMTKHLPKIEVNDVTAVYAYGASQTLVQVLTQCGDDLSRENIMKQAANLKDFELGVAVPGAKINTSASDFAPFSQMQLGRFNGKSFERFGDVMSAD